MSEEKIVVIHCAVCGGDVKTPEYKDAKCGACGQRYEYVGNAHTIQLRPDQVHVLYRHWQNDPSR